MFCIPDNIFLFDGTVYSIFEILIETPFIWQTRANCKKKDLYVFFGCQKAIFCIGSVWSQHSDQGARLILFSDVQQVQIEAHLRKKTLFEKTNISDYRQFIANAIKYDSRLVVQWVNLIWMLDLLCVCQHCLYVELIILKSNQWSNVRSQRLFSLYLNSILIYLLQVLKYHCTNTKCLFPLQIEGEQIVGADPSWHCTPFIWPFQTCTLQINLYVNNNVTQDFVCKFTLMVPIRRLRC